MTFETELEAAVGPPVTPTRTPRAEVLRETAAAYRARADELEDDAAMLRLEAHELELLAGPRPTCRGGHPREAETCDGTCRA